jgi:uncharacterized protein YjbI with pentapeptide repeats
VVQRLGDQIHFKNRKLRDLDLSGGNLDEVAFTYVAIENCKFDHASCREWRMWATQFTECDFSSADLRDSTLGSGLYEGRQCTWTRVSLRGANLRNTHCDQGQFTDCDFSDAALAKIEFDCTTFTACKFRGLLREVTFHGDAFGYERTDHNALNGVDLSRAELRWVDFRKLNLEGVKFPQDEDHVVISRYKCVLKRGLKQLSADESPIVKTLRSDFEYGAKWAGPSQRVQVINRRDLLEYHSEQNVNQIVEFWKRLEAECADADDANDEGGASNAPAPPAARLLGRLFRRGGR